MTWQTEIAADSPCLWFECEEDFGTDATATNSGSCTLGADTDADIDDTLGNNRSGLVTDSTNAFYKYSSSPAVIVEPSGDTAVGGLPASLKVQAFTHEAAIKMDAGEYDDAVLFGYVPFSFLYGPGYGIPTNTTQGAYVECNASGHVSFTVGNGTTRVSATDSSVDIFDGNTYLIAGVFDSTDTGDEIKLYINGALAATASISACDFTSESYDGGTYAPLWVLGSLTNVDMAVDEGLAFASALSPGRIAAHAVAGGVSSPEPPYSVELPIEVDTRPKYQVFAPVHVQTRESYSLDLPIHVRTDLIRDLYATIHVQAGEVYSVDLPILVQTSTAGILDADDGYYTLRVTLDGTDISDQLTGDWSVEYEEDASGLATVQIVPDAGVVSLGDYVGNRLAVTYRVLDSNGATVGDYLLFAGYVSDPVYHPAAGILTLDATTDLQGVLDAIDRTHLDYLVGGTWSPVVFEEGAQGFDYATDQLRSRPASMWHSPGGIVVTNWAAKTTPDLTFTADQVIAESVSYETATRRDLLNRVEISFDYRFQRMRQRTIAVNFRMYPVTFCELLINGFKLPQRQMVETASSGGGWYRQGDIYYVPLPGAGYYRCFPSASGPAAAKYIAWGREYLGYLLYDDDWDDLCWGASWKSARRWAQTVTERHAITVRSPQSQTGNGDIVSQESYALTSEQDIADWLDDAEFQGRGNKTGWTVVSTGESAGGDENGDVSRDATDDVLTGRAAADQARQVMIDVAKTDQLRAHRQNTVQWSSLFQPAVNLTRTIKLETDTVTAQGKCRRYRHSGSIDSGEATTLVELALSRHFGTGLVTDSPTTPDDAPDKPLEDDIPTTLYLGTNIGGRTDTSPLGGDEVGYFSNWIYDPSNTDPFAANPSDPEATLYPESFICEYPAIEGAALDALELPAEQVVDVDIPVDTLTLTQ